MITAIRIENGQGEIVTLTWLPSGVIIGIGDGENIMKAETKVDELLQAVELLGGKP